MAVLQLRKRDMVNPVNSQNTARNSVRRLYQTQIVDSRKTSRYNSHVLPCYGNSNSNAIGTLSLSEKVEAIFSRWHVHHKRLAPAAEKLFSSAKSLRKFLSSIFTCHTFGTLFFLIFCFLLFGTRAIHHGFRKERGDSKRPAGKGW